MEVTCVTPPELTSILNCKLLAVATPFVVGVEVVPGGGVEVVSDEDVEVAEGSGVDVASDVGEVLLFDPFTQYRVGSNSSS